MFRAQAKRLLVIAGLVLLCGLALRPRTGPDGKPHWPLNLGLDLQGGMHLAVEIDDPEGSLTDETRADAIDRTLTTIRNRIDEFGVTEPTIQKVGSDRIIVELAGKLDPERAEAIVERTAFLEFKIVREGDAFRQALPRIDRAIVDELGAENLTPVELEPEAAGLEEILGLSEEDTTAVDSTAAGADSAAAGAAGGQAPDSAAAGAESRRDLRPLTSLLRESGRGGIFLVAKQNVPTVERYLALERVRSLFPRASEIVWGVEQVPVGGNTYRELYVLESNPLVTGAELADAGPATRDPTFNQPIVPFEMTRRGARIFERGTSRNVGRQMAIVLDGKVQSAPVIQQTLSRRAQIEMGAGSSFQEAQDLALVLRAGALPEPIKIVERRRVGPSLGADSIREGNIAFIIGILTVLVVMIAYYRIAGALAVTALFMYVLLVLGGLAGLGATLTLPGIAGLILSVGMAVDANVLIFERIREELAGGKTARTAVDLGFEQALSAIVDANLTTLITAAILFQFGTGPVKGFAVTLSIGIVASFFTALFVTRTFFLMYLERHPAGEPVSI
ncbi:MAG: protein translocase subunit SecD [Gemmatimonadota bacterium]